MHHIPIAKPMINGHPIVGSFVKHRMLPIPTSAQEAIHLTICAAPFWFVVLMKLREQSHPGLTLMSVHHQYPSTPEPPCPGHKKSIRPKSAPKFGRTDGFLVFSWIITRSVCLITFKDPEFNFSSRTCILSLIWYRRSGVRAMFAVIRRTPFLLSQTMAEDAERVYSSIARRYSPSKGAQRNLNMTFLQIGWPVPNLTQHTSKNKGTPRVAPFHCDYFFCRSESRSSYGLFSLSIGFRSPPALAASATPETLLRS